MRRFWDFLLRPRTLGVIGLLALAAFLLLGANELQLALVWVGAILVLVLLVWGIVWWVRRRRAQKAAAGLEQALTEQADRAVKATPAPQRAETEALRERMLEAVKTIKTSKLGQTSGTAALYELPWYIVIGNPAAGKSSAIAKSGLHFPFADNSGAIIQGIGGTRNCDWFFTNEGILLDTAGRYSVHEEDREEWRGFLSLLKKHRPKAPINGIMIAASLAELAGNKPEFSIQLAKQLRQRVQELTEQLEVFAPVYVVFTKADLVAGFAEFFEDRDRGERDRAWGATLPYDADGKLDAVGQFERHFEELYEGLKASSVARMSLHRGEKLPPGVLTFPLEFASLKPVLRTFLTTLFEENPFQFRPIFRGFYFTSAVQQGASTSRSSERVAQRFALQLQPGTTAEVYSQTGFFLKDLFSKVVFADRNLVKQYNSRDKLRWRYAAFFGGVAALGVALAAWTWSYAGNRQLVENVQADLNQVVKLQANRTDLQSRLEALEVLRDRLVQLQSYRERRPWSLSLGLYQGKAVEEQLKREYFAGIQEVLLQPVATSIESYLAEVNANPGQLQPVSPASAGASSAPQAAAAAANAQASVVRAQPLPTHYSAASPTDVTDAYNALKSYLMLADRSRAEPGHLSDQLTRFWRGWLETNRGTMPREQMIRSAESLISFTVTQLADAQFPVVQNNLALLDQTRENLRRVIKGMPARERVYSEIKAKASTQFPPVTVANLVGELDKDVIAGSYAISGAFTRRAWDEFVENAIKDAAYKELQSDDWVLKTTVVDDLSLEGSPEQIQKALVHMYKTEYVREWQKFMQGVSVQEFASFDQAVGRMNRLGDPATSPIGRLMQALYDETSWDNPSLLNHKLEQSQRGFVDWFKQTVLRQSVPGVQVNVDLKPGQGAAVPMGPIGKEFAGLARVMLPPENQPPLIRRYLDALSKVRTRFNQMKTQGDPGPASRELMKQTLENNGSELADALRLVDEQMLVGMSDTAKLTLRPLLVRPLMQAYGVVVRPAENEINRLWNAEVYELFQKTLAPKYPFTRSASIEAAPADIAKVFGPEGAIAKFSEKTLGPLVHRAGDDLKPRTWADMGVRLAPEFTTQFGAWVAPLSGASSGGGSGGAAAPAAEQTVFQLLPQPAPGLMEYTVEIDGQVMRYRNTTASWTHFVWPGPQGTPGVRITGQTFDGRTIEFINHPGRFGLERMVNSAQRRRLPNGHELKWTANNLTVAVHLKIISTPGAAPAANAAPTPAQGSAAGLRGAVLPRVIAGESAAAGTPAVTTTASSTSSATGSAQ
ncbi:type VI secretion system membrane subunit TssM [Aquabacterium sp. A7-Y]|uniref:type VI secretion system membrane subunit TssM n=1 Tax=Aquabacterium sp. A7-Y TaxID=1349605 RepID=UPI00223CAF9B|nr:type VI secretion system membrane subunit TssM [Aquabacterium sp. A7-Y]MCW7537695.1 type VI secretion system membrane subunit TssM [Aquabacterium sp. A7-Y]